MIEQLYNHKQFQQVSLHADALLKWLNQCTSSYVHPVRVYFVQLKWQNWCGNDSRVGRITVFTKILYSKFRHPCDSQTTSKTTLVLLYKLFQYNCLWLIKLITPVVLVISAFCCKGAWESAVPKPNLPTFNWYIVQLFLISYFYYWDFYVSWFNGYCLLWHSKGVASETKLTACFSELLLAFVVHILTGASCVPDLLYTCGCWP